MRATTCSIDCSFADRHLRVELAVIARLTAGASARRFPLRDRTMTLHDTAACPRAARPSSAIIGKNTACVTGWSKPLPRMSSGHANDAIPRLAA